MLSHIFYALFEFVCNTFLGVIIMSDSFLSIFHPFWHYFNIAEGDASQLIRDYFGSPTTLTDINAAIDYLRSVLESVQSDIKSQIVGSDPINMIGQLYSIFDRTFRHYTEEKQDRMKIDALHLRNEELIKSYSLNRNAYMYLLSASNIWIENYLLLYGDIKTTPNTIIDDINKELFIKLYIYGVVSQNLSLLTISRKFKDTTKFPYPVITYCSLVINEDICNPIELTQYHPVIYYDPLVCGNQGLCQSSLEKLEDADSSDFGIGFKKEYGLEFSFFLKILNTLLKIDFSNGEVMLFALTKQGFLDRIKEFSSSGEVNPSLFYDSFVLDKNKIATQLKKDEDLIWRPGVNKYRHEIRPFISLDDDRVFLSYAAIEQAKQIWMSHYSNGGIIYSNSSAPTDALLQGIELNTKHRTKELVSLIHSILLNHYTPEFDEIEVQYSRIFGELHEDYGDFDIIFYTGEPKKELFLIEAKYFSDSLNPAARMTDYEKLFRKGKYYDHCRKRCDLVLSNPDAIKQFVKADGSINVHFLFISSKPLEIEFTDKDGVVAFPCLSIFEKYLEGKIESEDGSKIIRPFHTI